MLARALPADAPVAVSVLALGRPAAVARLEPLGVSGELRELEPLLEPVAAQVATDRGLGRLTGAQAEALALQAGGNPWLLRSLVEGALQPGGPVVPEPALGRLAAELEPLGVEGRRVLRRWPSGRRRSRAATSARCSARPAPAPPSTPSSSGWSRAAGWCAPGRRASGARRATGWPGRWWPRRRWRTSPRPTRRWRTGSRPPAWSSGPTPSPRGSPGTRSRPASPPAPPSSTAAPRWPRGARRPRRRRPPRRPRARGRRRSRPARRAARPGRGGQPLAGAARRRPGGRG